MLKVLIGAFILSVVHALMPDHWIPPVMISRAEKWTKSETLWVTALITIPHLISTIMIGIIVGIIGYQISSAHELLMETIAPLVFIIIGFAYIYSNFRADGRHNLEMEKVDGLKNRSKKTIISLLATALFFSPCVPIGSYFFIAGATGLYGIISVLAIYLIVTMVVMLLMVYLGMKGVEKLKWQFLEQNEHLITGMILLALGIIIYFIEI